MKLKLLLLAGIITTSIPPSLAQQKGTSGEIAALEVRCNEFFDEANIALQARQRGNSAAKKKRYGVAVNNLSNCKSQLEALIKTNQETEIVPPTNSITVDEMIGEKFDDLSQDEKNIALVMVIERIAEHLKGEMASNAVLEYELQQLQEKSRILGQLNDNRYLGITVNDLIESHFKLIDLVCPDELGMSTNSLIRYVDVWPGGRCRR